MIYLVCKHDVTADKTEEKPWLQYWYLLKSTFIFSAVKSHWNQLQIWGIFWQYFVHINAIISDLNLSHCSRIIISNVTGFHTNPKYFELSLEGIKYFSERWDEMCNAVILSWSWVQSRFPFHYNVGKVKSNLINVLFLLGKVTSRHSQDLKTR